MVRERASGGPAQAPILISCRDAFCVLPPSQRPSACPLTLAMQPTEPDGRYPRLPDGR
jgi:hypothetical protein